VNPSLVFARKRQLLRYSRF